MPAGRLWVDVGRISARIFRPVAANRRVKAVPTNPVVPVMATVSIMVFFDVRQYVSATGWIIHFDQLLCSLIIGRFEFYSGLDGLLAER
jgi:hypothetical protein